MKYWETIADNLKKADGVWLGLKRVAQQTHHGTLRANEENTSGDIEIY